MISIDLYKKYLEKFENVKFNEKGHFYLVNGIKALSVTSILKKYVKPFERDYWARIKAEQAKISVEEMLKKWDFNSKLSQIKGTLIHQFIENALTKTNFTYPKEMIIESFGYDPIQDLFNQIIPTVKQFLLDIENKMLPVASEFIVGDADYLVGGTIDQIFFNKKSNKLEIWDWKTNKEIKTESRYFHLSPLDHIPDTELDHYSLQLSLYKLILEKNTGLEIGDCYLTWFNERSSKYNIYRIKNYKKEAALILNN